MTTWITIDGSEGEGGGQILRTALALSLVTGKPFRIDRIRAARRKPGLLRQHLTAVHAAREVGGARVDGATLGSSALTFEPGDVRPGEYHLAVGTAGSATLVMQTVLPALLRAPRATRLTLEGGTHNPYAPPFEFIEKAFLPVLRRMGAAVDVCLEAHGFYPAGGGRLTVSIAPCTTLGRVDLHDRGAVRVCALALLSSLPEIIAKRELSVVRERLGIAREQCRIDFIETSPGPGNVLLIMVDGEHGAEVVTGFGVKGISAEKVASAACDEAERYLTADIPVGSHLADQLLIPMVLAGGGSFRTVPPTPHTVTNARIIQKFADMPIAIENESAHVCRVNVG